MKKSIKKVWRTTPKIERRLKEVLAGKKFNESLLVETSVEYYLNSKKFRDVCDKRMNLKMKKTDVSHTTDVSHISKIDANTIIVSTIEEADELLGMGYTLAEYNTIVKNSNLPDNPDWDDEDNDTINGILNREFLTINEPDEDDIPDEDVERDSDGVEEDEFS